MDKKELRNWLEIRLEAIPEKVWQEFCEKEDVDYTPPDEAAQQDRLTRMVLALERARKGIRTSIERSLGEIIPDVLWEELRNRDEMIYALDGDLRSLKTLTKTARKRLAYIKDAAAQMVELGSMIPQVTSTKPPSRPGRTVTKEVVVGLDPDEVLRAEALSEYFAEHAANQWQVRVFREIVIAKRPFVDMEAEDRHDGYASLLLPSESPEAARKVLASLASNYPGHNILTDEEARALLSSPATRYLSYEQFIEWDIPVIGHTSRLGVPFREDGLYRAAKHDGPSVALTIDPPGSSFVIRASDRAAVVDGYRMLDGIEPPDFPAVPDYDLDEAIKTAIREATEGIQQVDHKQTRRESETKFESTLVYPAPSGQTAELSVWPGSLLDKLREIGEDLARDYHWRMQDAVWFVLTGEVPQVRPLVVKSMEMEHPDFVRKHITIEAAPWVPYETVKKAYQQVQRRALGGDNRKPVQQTIDVFRYITRNAGVQVDRGQWNKLLQRWNNDRPEQRMRSTARLKEIHNRAKSVLLGERQERASGSA